MTTVPGAAEPGILSPAYRALTLGSATLIAASAFEAIAVATAMPAVGKALDGLALYPLAFGMPIAASVIGMVASGAWADRTDARRPLALGAVLFFTGLMLAGAAGDMTMLIAGRAAQGLGSGLLNVAVYVLVGAAYPAELRPRIFSAFAAAWILPALIGPALAGLTVDHLGWPWIFFGVSPLVVVGLIAVLKAYPDKPEPAAEGAAEPARWSAGSQMAAAVAVATGACLLQVAHHQTSLAAVLFGIGGAVALLLGLPILLPRGTYRSLRGLPTIVLLRGLAAATFTTAEVFLPLLLVEERGLATGLAGIALSVGALGWSAGSAWQGRHSSVPRRILILRTGLTLMAAGVAATSTVLLAAVPWPLALIGWTIAGFGMGLTFPTLSVLMLETAAPSQHGSASSALQVNDASLSALALAGAGALFAGPLPYLAGFVIAFGAAATGLLLAPRVRT